MANNVITFDHVTKIYKLYKNDKQRFLGIFSKKIKYKENKAVNDLSFCVKKGESVALFGKNGAGKSTLMKLLVAGLTESAGTILADGAPLRKSALLELTAGFDGEFTGRENIYLKCNIMGMTDEQVAEVEEQIVEFAEIGDYIDQPVRTYSSGMKSRLGFSINVNVEPEILIVDEALSVGDKAFQQKCIKKVNQIMENGDVTFLFVTHSSRMAKAFCKRGIVLEKGKMIFDGDIEKAIEIYEK